MDPATAKWLASEYGVTNAAEKSRSVSRAQKHALVVRTCACGRKIAGNVYFRHVKICPSAVAAGSRNHPISWSQQLNSHERSVARINVQIGVSAPVLEGGVRIWQF